MTEEKTGATIHTAPEVDALDGLTRQKASWWSCQLLFHILPTEPIDSTGLWEHAIVSIVPVRATDREAADREAERIGAGRDGERVEHPQDEDINAELHFVGVRKVVAMTELGSGLEVSNVRLAVVDADAIERLVDGDVWEVIFEP